MYSKYAGANVAIAVNSALDSSLAIKRSSKDIFSVQTKNCRPYSLTASFKKCRSRFASSGIPFDAPSQGLDDAFFTLADAPQGVELLWKHGDTRDNHVIERKVEC